MTPSDDSLFTSLPAYLQHKIDRAFDASGAHDIFTPSHHDIQSSLDSGGGFLNGDQTQAQAQSGGGFLIEDARNSIAEVGQPHKIPMSSIPSALQRLDLPPDDEQVLAVFRNASSGWVSSTSDNANDQEMDRGMVSRDDWRSVCAVLLEHYEEEYGDESDGDPVERPIQDSGEDVASDDLYLESNDDSDDEYIEDTKTSSSRRRTRGRLRKSSSRSPSADPSSSEPKRLSKRQHQTAVEAFSLFFPSVPLSEVVDQKIMLKDIQRVAKVLGEKIKAEEMLEMLEAFSNSPDKSISFADFGRIMVTARLA